MTRPFLTSVTRIADFTDNDYTIVYVNNAMEAMMRAAAAKRVAWSE